MMATVSPPPISADERFVLYGVDWQTYEALRRNLGDRPIRLTYDGSSLEFISPSRGHERAKKLLARMIEFLAAELDITMSCGGSMTFQRADLERGLEPDECYWITNEPAVAEKGELDFTIDPPPDLAIEIDISPSRLNRRKIYAALGVPEIWRYDGNQLFVELLGSDGQYCLSTKSMAFPFLPMDDLTRFVTLAEQRGDSQAFRLFVKWVREQNFTP